ncbi:UNVERIFIED_ORG: putative anti-sigma-YlaC factor YlaD [Xanthomonas axonopodis]
MLNSVDAGRRLMLRAAVYSLAAVAITSLGLLLVGPRYAAGLALTGFATVLGGWVAARTALGGGIQAAGIAMVRLILAMVLKWVLVFVALALGFGPVAAASSGFAGRYRHRADFSGSGSGQALIRT